MNSIIKHGNLVNEFIMSIYGLSTDTKPTITFNGEEITNGSSYYEMDTKKAYLYDKEHETWIAQ